MHHGIMPRNEGSAQPGQLYILKTPDGLANRCYRAVGPQLTAHLSMAGRASARSHAREFFLSHCDSREADTGREKGFGTGAGCAGRYARKQGDKARSVYGRHFCPGCAHRHDTEVCIGGSGKGRSLVHFSGRYDRCCCSCVWLLFDADKKSRMGEIMWERRTAPPRARTRRPARLAVIDPASYRRLYW